MLQSAQLYGILDLGYVASGDLLRVAEQMIEGGVEVLQLRARQRSRRDDADDAFVL